MSDATTETDTPAMPKLAATLEWARAAILRAADSDLRPARPRATPSRHSPVARRRPVNLHDIGPSARRLPAACDAIASAIARLFRAVDSDGDEAARTLQDLVNQLLDAAPAASTALLERRLLGLARAMEELGTRAAPTDLVRRAVACSEHVH